MGKACSKLTRHLPGVSLLLVRAQAVNTPTTQAYRVFQSFLRVNNPSVACAHPLFCAVGLLKNDGTPSPDMFFPKTRSLGQYVIKLLRSLGMALPRRSNCVLKVQVEMLKDHHIQLDVAEGRPDYRESRLERAVKVSYRSTSRLPNGTKGHVLIKKLASRIL